MHSFSPGAVFSVHRSLRGQYWFCGSYSSVLGEHCHLFPAEETGLEPEGENLPWAASGAEARTQALAPEPLEAPCPSLISGYIACWCPRLEAYRLSFQSRAMAQLSGLPPFLPGPCFADCPFMCLSAAVPVRLPFSLQPSQSSSP